jgi:hypothetical protein
VNKYLRQEDRVSEDLPFGSRGGLAIRYYFPVDADCRVRCSSIAPTTAGSAVLAMPTSGSAPERRRCRS